MERKREKGQVLVVFVGALTALIGFAAVGIDVGYMYTVRHELQRCADAGALAGASAFLDGDWNDQGIKDIATTRAQTFASKDVVAKTALSTGEIDVKFPGPDRVRVEATRTVGLFFSSMFLGPTKTIGASAVAEATSVGRNVRGLKPWGIPFPWDDTNGNGLYDPGETVHRDCPEGVVDPSRYFCPGTRIVLKIGTPENNPSNPNLPSLQQEPGHFFALDYDASGADGYREAIQTDSPFRVSIDQAVPLETGNMVGPTIQGVEDLISADSGSHWNGATNLPESDAYGTADSRWMASPRVVRIPIYDPETALVNGKSEMVVAGFAGFWIESVDHHLGTVIGRFVPNRAIGNIGPGGGPTGGPALKVLRLVE
ncbi:MAG: pilus assembly protein TadG-related protein [Deltaproteobacteria bacterium]|nr:pilus assembly protein TadG-related protein [Candidatus Deferrimicrobiaceae bacterium]